MMTPTLLRRPSPARVLALVLTLALTTLCGCASRPPAPLFDRLGGQAKVEEVVGNTLRRAASDPRTMRSFDGVKLLAVQKSLTQQICALSGGGCVYEGETMARSHKELKIRPSEFDALVEILREEFDRAGVDAGAKNELLRVLAPMKRDIVAVN
ncbi:MAG: group 1 truncated hemoglobin [Burkholderiaceae bacterium]